MTYKFEQFNQNGVEIEIVDPSVEAFPDTISVMPTQMKIDVDIKLSVPGTVYGMRLYGCPVNSLTFNDYQALIDIVMNRLNDFAVV